MKKLFLFFTLIFTAFAANSGLFDKKQTFLKVDDAFAFSATLSTDKSQLQAHWDIADGYYLYQDKINAELLVNQILSLYIPNRQRNYIKILILAK